jgi:hypothetical protein
MDRDRLEKALERAEERIVLGEKQIAHQKETIAELERAGKSSAFEMPRATRRKLTSSCGLSGALRPRSMGLPLSSSPQVRNLVRKSAASHRSVRIRTVGLPGVTSLGAGRSCIRA